MMGGARYGSRRKAMCLVAPNVLAVMQQTSAIGRKSPALLLWYLRTLRFAAIHALVPRGLQRADTFMSIELAAGQGRSIFDMESGKGGQMKAARVLRFGPPSVIRNDELPKPHPAAGQLLVRVKAAGVGNWDALIREGKGCTFQPLPHCSWFRAIRNCRSNRNWSLWDSKLGMKSTAQRMRSSAGAYAEYALPLGQKVGAKTENPELYTKRLQFRLWR